MAESIQYEQLSAISKVIGTVDAEIKDILGSFASGNTLGEVAGIDKSQLETIYKMASQLFESGSYAKSHDIFSSLCFFCHNDKRYWFGLGASCEKQKNYPSAIRAYMSACMQDMNDPRPRLQIALCQVKMDDKVKAIQTLESLLSIEPSEHINNADKMLIKKANTLLATLLDTTTEK